MENITFEEISNKHLKSVLDIYTYYVLNTTATFHDHQVTLDEMEALTMFDNPIYKTFVILQDDSLCGYVTIKQHKAREAYDTTAEISVYLRQDYIGKGLGSKAVKFIENYARSKNLHALVATICGQNSNSINLFSHNGYFECAHYKEVGKKFGQLLDVVAYEKIL